MSDHITITSENGSTSIVPCVPGKTSDGYHTIDELYEHRCLLFCMAIAAFNGNPQYSQYCWKSLHHHDGSEMEGWFIAGIKLDGIGDVTYHLPESLWDACLCQSLDRAPQWDGHTSDDVLNRLRQWLGLQ